MHIMIFMTILSRQTCNIVEAFVYNITDVVYIKFMHHLKISDVSLARRYVNSVTQQSQKYAV